MSALDPVLVAAIRETVDWIGQANFSCGFGSRANDWGEYMRHFRDVDTSRAVLDRLLSEAE